MGENGREWAPEWARMGDIIDGVDYGPLAQLIGRWIGEHGTDIAPEPDGSNEHNEYVDKLTFSPAGITTNAEELTLVAVKYHHLVRKKDSGLIFHDQIGHWLYQANTKTIMHSLSIPRGVCLLAGGILTADSTNSETVFSVKAEAGSASYGIVQSRLCSIKPKLPHLVCK